MQRLNFVLDSALLSSSMRTKSTSDFWHLRNKQNFFDNAYIPSRGLV